MAKGTSTAGTGEDYHNAKLDVEQRVDDLLDRMSLAEKAGMLFQTMIVIGSGDLSEPSLGFGVGSAEHMIHTQLLTHFNLVRTAEDAKVLAEWHNRLQKLASETRLGIPITLSTDPRHHFTENTGTAAMAGAFSQWPETLGFAAIASADLVERFADIARQEYLAVGLRLALHPQIDLATEPRWSRISGGFGEDADLTGRLVRAYIRGLQGSQLGSESVSTMTKHFPGGGPQQDGEDPHFAYGPDRFIPATISNTTSNRFGTRSLQERPKSCRTTECRWERNTRKSPSLSTKESSLICCAVSSVSTASCVPTGAW
jgi:beta-glucosidase